MNLKNNQIEQETNPNLNEYCLHLANYPKTRIATDTEQNNQNRPDFDFNDFANRFSSYVAIIRKNIIYLQDPTYKQNVALRFKDGVLIFYNTNDLFTEFYCAVAVQVAKNITENNFVDVLHNTFLNKDLATIDNNAWKNKIGIYSHLKR